MLQPIRNSILRPLLLVFQFLLSIRNVPEKSAIIFSVFDSVEKYAHGFKDSIVGVDILTPSDLERVFGLTGGVSLVTLHYDEEICCLLLFFWNGIKVAKNSKCI